ncbi:MAG: hypothetical protein QW727_01630 [Candidatus Pacearchaeota archaeon]
MKEHRHVANILEETKKAVRDFDITTLKNLSNETIHSAAIYQDTDNILIAVIVYALSKLIERKEDYKSKSFEKYLDYYLKTLEFSKECISKNDCDAFRDRLNEIMNVPGLSENIKTNVLDVFRKAKINKASKIYEHGISMEATSKLLGISMWELSEYVGQSQISEMKENKTFDVKKRIKIAMEFFNK